MFDCLKVFFSLYNGVGKVSKEQSLCGIIKNNVIKIMSKTWKLLHKLKLQWKENLKTNLRYIHWMNKTSK